MTDASVGAGPRRKLYKELRMNINKDRELTQGLFCANCLMNLAHQLTSQSYVAVTFRQKKKE